MFSHSITVQGKGKVILALIPTVEAHYSWLATQVIISHANVTQCTYQGYRRQLNHPNGSAKSALNIGRGLMTQLPPGVNSFTPASLSVYM